LIGPRFVEISSKPCGVIRKPSNGELFAL
jgi:hypothetical protein